MCYLEATHIGNIQHFRMDYINFRQIEGTRLYRASRPDILPTDQIESLKSLGIKCIIDLRSPLEVRGAVGSLPVDNLYQPMVIERDGKFKDISTKAESESRGTVKWGRYFKLTIS